MKRGYRNVLGAGVVAAALAMTSDGPWLATAYALPQPRTEGSVTFMSGGLTGEEAEAMRREAANYPLSLEFLLRMDTGNEHIGGVVVGIADQAGNNALTARARGPLLLARLPDGAYAITVDHNGKTKTSSVVIDGQKPQHLVFVW
jgi:hypothetical protein